jgi:TRAP-type C4-dicarboxylate transport system substrate-binding protein
LEPNHRLLLTNIIVNKNFLASLPAELQQVMKDAALEAGRFERAVAVAEVEPTKARCEQDGIRVIRFSEADEQTFRTVTARVYDQFANTFTAGLVDKIQKA